MWWGGGSAVVVWGGGRSGGERKWPLTDYGSEPFDFVSNFPAASVDESKSFLLV